MVYAVYLISLPSHSDYELAMRARRQARRYRKARPLL